MHIVECSDHFHVNYFENASVRKAVLRIGIMIAN